MFIQQITMSISADLQQEFMRLSLGLEGIRFDHLAAPWPGQSLAALHTNFDLLVHYQCFQPASPRSCCPNLRLDSTDKQKNNEPNLCTFLQTNLLGVDNPTMQKQMGTLFWVCFICCCCFLGLVEVFFIGTEKLERIKSLPLNHISSALLHQWTSNNSQKLHFYKLIWSLIFCTTSLSRAGRVSNPNHSVYFIFLFWPFTKKKINCAVSRKTTGIDLAEGLVAFFASGLLSAEYLLLQQNESVLCPLKEPLNVS